MSIKDWWNSIFKPKTNISSNEIIKYKALINIPKRKEFKHNKEIISIINEYKKKYKDILNTDVTIVSKHLSFGDFYEELRINTNLLLNIIIKHEDNPQVTFEKEPEIEKKLKKELNHLKLNLYEQRINEMELETKIRGIALTEVYHERLLFLNENKINAINEELYSLTIQLNNFYSQKEAIKREKQTYQTELELAEAKDKITFEKIEKLAKIKYEYLLNNTNFIPDIISELNDKEESFLSKLAYLERQLEIYAYQNKDLLDQIDARLEHYLSFQEITEENKDKLLNEITYFEQLCKIFNEYSRNNQVPEILKKLYTFKFELLTFDIFKQNQTPFFQSNTSEFKIYEEIIMRKISILLNPDNKITQHLFDNDLTKALKIIINILKKGNNNTNNFEPDKILIDITKLKLLLSFDTEDGLQKFYNTTKVKYDYFVNRYGVNFHQNIFSWNKEVPLESIYRWQIFDPVKTYIQTTEPLFNLYTYFNKHRKIDKSTYYIPDGIAEIKMESNLNGEELQDFTAFQKDLARYNPDIKVICPPSLKTWNGYLFGSHIFNDHNVSKIVLNNRLEILGDGSVLRINNTTITIPSTLRKINANIFNINTLNTITFDDFQNSNLLHDKTSLVNFLKPFIVGKINNKKELPLKEYIRKTKKDKLADLEFFLEFEVADFAFHKENYTEYQVEISLSLEKVIFNIDSHNSIILSKDDLTIKDIINTVDISEEKILEKLESEEYIYKIIDKLEKLVFEKTGHILFQNEQEKQSQNNKSTHKI